MLTLTPDVDFDLDFVNTRIRDGTGTFMACASTWREQAKAKAIEASTKR